MDGRTGAELSRSSFYSATTAIHFQPLLPLLHNIPVTLLTYTDRLYLGCYTEKPTASTAFPYGKSQSQGSPSKRSQRAVAAPSAVPSTSSQQTPYYFSVDDTLLYNAFHHDFGPLHIGHLYRFALHFHDVLGAKENESRPIVFWSRADPKCTSFHFAGTIEESD